MKNKKQKLRITENAQGITLVALVVTIIVLIILATISVNIIFSDEGILERAKEAGDKQRQAELNEIYAMNSLMDQIDIMLYGDIGLNVTEEEIKLYSNSEDKNTYKINVETTAKSLIYKSSDENIATVDENGNVTAIKAGTCEIIVSDNHEVINDKVNIIVEELVEGITLDKVAIDDFINSNYSAVNKLTDTIVATISNEDATNKGITWSSSDESVATVDENGKVTAIAAGNCTITATANDEGKKAASCEVTVKERKYLYYYGNEFTDVTGGWVVGNDFSIATYYSDLGKKNADNLYIGYRSSYWWVCGFMTKNNINTEDYNSLVMETNLYVHGESWQENIVGYGIRNISQIEKGGATTVSGTFFETIDISAYHNMSNYCYIFNKCTHTAQPYSGYDRNSYIYLYQAYLEK